MKSRINKLEYRFELNITTKYYYKNELHRDKDLPAVIRRDGSRGWFKNGYHHRDNDKPSTIYSDGTLYWHENGKYIRSNLNEI